MAISDKDTKKLWGLAAGRCGNPDCGQDCIRFFSASTPTIIGEMAHIIDKRSSGTRRGDGAGADTYENLILLCPTHHTEIDKAPEGTFPVELLHKWKAAHEKKIRDLLSVKKFANRVEFFRHIRRLLIDNNHIYKQFGPASEEAKINPISNVATIWGIRKISQIVPNNRKICSAIRENYEFISDDEYEICGEFLIHAEAFESHCYDRIEMYPTFPQSFSKMVEHNVRQ